MHTLPSEQDVRTLEGRASGMAAAAIDMLRTGECSPRECLRGLVRDHSYLAGWGMVLKREDVVVARHFADAAAFAQQWLTAPSASERPGTPPEWWDGWHVGIYDTMLELLIAFGHETAAREAAAVPEARYRSSPEVFAEEANFAVVRAKRAWVLGDDDLARHESVDAQRNAQHPMWKNEAQVFVSMLNQDEQGLQNAFTELLKGHKREASRHSRYGNFVYSLPALAFARMARTYGMTVPEMVYLPVRLLPPEPIRAL